MKSAPQNHSIDLAREFIKIEANAIEEVSKQLDESFSRAVEMISACKGKVVFCGIGKSGHIANKLSSTFSSIGIPSVFLHPSEGVHGDLGLLDEKDILIFISFSGETAELGIPLKYAARKKIPMIAITGGRNSTLAKHANTVLMTEISKEACPFNLAPTASTTAALVLGDALGLVAAKAKGYSAEKFAEIHPAGSLGLRLTMVQDLMQPVDKIATVLGSDTIKTLLAKMTHSSIRGVAAVVDANHKLLGSVTDGDIRRFLEKASVDLNQKVETLMNPKPKSLLPIELVEKAISLMEEHKIQSVFIADQNHKLLGLLHIQSILGQKFR